MPQGFKKLHFDVTEKGEGHLRAVGARPLTVRGEAKKAVPEEVPTFNSPEAAARHYLAQLLEYDERPAVRGLAAPGRPEVVPEMQHHSSQQTGGSDHWTVQFVQTRASIPVFGSRVVVELDRDRELLAADGDLAVVGDVSALAAVSPAQCLKAIADGAGVPVAQLASVEAPQTTFYHDEDSGQWHLAYLFKHVPAAPTGFFETSRSHGIGGSLARRHPDLHYLVDAHDGRILLSWSAVPTIDIPIACTGTDETGASQNFYGCQVPPTQFELRDPLAGVRTHDFALGDIESQPPPPDPIRSATTVFGTQAAVSAHVNALKVVEFCKSVLMRDSLDDKGMEIVSYVNCTAPSEERPPDWHNAAWWKQRMWYGQADDGGQRKSYSRFLDVIAHELTHGLTEFTASLVYRRQSGALNESFSDIFGIIVKNWDWSQRSGGDVAHWSWEMGPGLGGNGKPLRDFSDPRRTEAPDHMRDYVNTAADSGGVHTNSNIHNKAAYNVLTARDAQGQRAFTPREVALLYYLTLTRLGQLASFSDARQALLSVAGSYFVGSAQRQEKLDAIRNAYDAVGIA